MEGVAFPGNGVLRINSQYSGDLDLNVKYTIDEKSERSNGYGKFYTSKLIVNGMTITTIDARDMNAGTFVSKTGNPGILVSEDNNPCYSKILDMITNAINAECEAKKLTAPERAISRGAVNKDTGETYSPASKLKVSKSDLFILTEFILIGEDGSFSHILSNENIETDDFRDMKRTDDKSNNKIKPHQKLANSIYGIKDLNARNIDISKLKYTKKPMSDSNFKDCMSKYSVKIAIIGIQNYYVKADGVPSVTLIANKAYCEPRMDAQAIADDISRQIEAEFRSKPKQESVRAEALSEVENLLDSL